MSAYIKIQVSWKKSGRLNIIIVVITTSLQTFTSGPESLTKRPLGNNHRAMALPDLFHAFFNNFITQLHIRIHMKYEFPLGHLCPGQTRMRGILKVSGKEQDWESRLLLESLN